jgi:predicted Zn-dependent protease
MNTSTRFSPTIHHRHARRWLYPLLSAIFAAGTVVAVPHPARADLFDLIFEGIRILQISTMSDAQEVEVGQQINQQILQEVRIYNNSSITQYVNDIAQSLAQFSHRPQIPYTVQVIENNEINAFSTLGGYIYLNTGLLRAADNEAQLASVIAHEMGHIERKHALQQLQQAAIAEGILSVGGLDQNTAIALGVDLALHRPNSRAHELEADQVGLTLLKSDGYAPIAAVNFLRKLVNQPGQVPDFFSTHPNPEDRITALESQMDPVTSAIGKGLNGTAYRYRIRALL